MSEFYEIEVNQYPASKITPGKTLHGFVEVEDEKKSDYSLDVLYGVSGKRTIKGVYKGKGLKTRQIKGTLKTADSERNLVFNERTGYMMAKVKCEFFLNKDGTSSTGWWADFNSPGVQVPAKLTMFKPLTDKEVGTKKVKSFLEKGYLTIDNKED